MNVLKYALSDTLIGWDDKSSVGASKLLTSLKAGRVELHVEQNSDVAYLYDTFLDQEYCRHKGYAKDILLHLKRRSQSMQKDSIDLCRKCHQLKTSSVVVSSRAKGPLIAVNLTEDEKNVEWDDLINAHDFTNVAKAEDSNDYYDKLKDLFVKEKKYAENYVQRVYHRSFPPRIKELGLAEPSYHQKIPLLFADLESPFRNQLIYAQPGAGKTALLLMLLAKLKIDFHRRGKEGTWRSIYATTPRLKSDVAKDKWAYQFVINLYNQQLEKNRQPAVNFSFENDVAVISYIELVEKMLLDGRAVLSVENGLVTFSDPDEDGAFYFTENENGKDPIDYIFPPVSKKDPLENTHLVIDECDTFYEFKLKEVRGMKKSHLYVLQAAVLYSRKTSGEQKKEVCLVLSTATPKSTKLNETFTMLSMLTNGEIKIDVNEKTEFLVRKNLKAPEYTKILGDIVAFFGKLEPGDNLISYLTRKEDVLDREFSEFYKNFGALKNKGVDNVTKNELIAIEKEFEELFNKGTLFPKGEKSKVAFQESERLISNIIFVLYVKGELLNFRKNFDGQRQKAKKTKRDLGSPGITADTKKRKAVVLKDNKDPGITVFPFYVYFYARFVRKVSTEKGDYKNVYNNYKKAAVDYFFSVVEDSGIATEKKPEKTPSTVIEELEETPSTVIEEPEETPRTVIVETYFASETSVRPLLNQWKEIESNGFYPKLRGLVTYIDLSKDYDHFAKITEKTAEVKLTDKQQNEIAESFGKYGNEEENDGDGAFDDDSEDGSVSKSSKVLSLAKFFIKTKDPRYYDVLDKFKDVENLARLMKFAVRKENEAKKLTISKIREMAKLEENEEKRKKLLSKIAGYPLTPVLPLIRYVDQFVATFSEKDKYFLAKYINDYNTINTNNTNRVVKPELLTQMLETYLLPRWEDVKFDAKNMLDEEEIRTALEKIQEIELYCDTEDKMSMTNPSFDIASFSFQGDKLKTTVDLKKVAGSLKDAPLISALLERLKEYDKLETSRKRTVYCPVPGGSKFIAAHLLAKGYGWIPVIRIGGTSKGLKLGQTEWLPEVQKNGKTFMFLTDEEVYSLQDRQALNLTDNYQLTEYEMQPFSKVVASETYKKFKKPVVSSDDQKLLQVALNQFLKENGNIVKYNKQEGEIAALEKTITDLQLKKFKNKASSNKRDIQVTSKKIALKKKQEEQESLKNDIPQETFDKYMDLKKSISTLKAIANDSSENVEKLFKNFKKTYENDFNENYLKEKIRNNSIVFDVNRQSSNRTKTSLAELIEKYFKLLKEEARNDPYEWSKEYRTSEKKRFSDLKRSEEDKKNDPKIQQNQKNFEARMNYYTQKIENLEKSDWDTLYGFYEHCGKELLTETRSWEETISLPNSIKVSNAADVAQIPGIDSVFIDWLMRLGLIRWSPDYDMKMKSERRALIRSIFNADDNFDGSRCNTLLLDRPYFTGIDIFNEPTMEIVGSILTQSQKEQLVGRIARYNGNYLMENERTNKEPYAINVSAVFYRPKLYTLNEKLESEEAKFSYKGRKRTYAETLREMAEPETVRQTNAALDEFFKASSTTKVFIDAIGEKSVDVTRVNSGFTLDGYRVYTNYSKHPSKDFVEKGSEKFSFKKDLLFWFENGWLSYSRDEESDVPHESKAKIERRVIEAILGDNAYLNEKYKSLKSSTIQSILTDNLKLEGFKTRVDKARSVFFTNDINAVHFAVLDPFKGNNKDWSILIKETINAKFTKKGNAPTYEKRVDQKPPTGTTSPVLLPRDKYQFVFEYKVGSSFEDSMKDRYMVASAPVQFTGSGRDIFSLFEITTGSTSLAVKGTVDQNGKSKSITRELAFRYWQKKVRYLMELLAPKLTGQEKEEEKKKIRDLLNENIDLLLSYNFQAFECVSNLRAKIINDGMRHNIISLSKKIGNELIGTEEYLFNHILAFRILTFSLFDGEYKTGNADYIASHAAAIQSEMKRILFDISEKFEGFSVVTFVEAIKTGKYGLYALPVFLVQDSPANYGLYKFEGARRTKLVSAALEQIDDRTKEGARKLKKEQAVQRQEIMQEAELNQSTNDSDTKGPPEEEKSVDDDDDDDDEMDIQVPESGQNVTISELEKQNASLKKELETVRQANAKLFEEKSLLKEELETCSANEQLLKGEIRKGKLVPKETIIKKTQLKEQEQLIENLKKGILVLQSEKTEQVKNFDKILGEKDVLIKQLQTEVSELRQPRSIPTNFDDALKDETIKKLGNKIKLYDNSLKAQLEENETLKAQNEMITKELRGKTVNLEKRNRDFLKVKEELEKLKGENESISKKLNKQTVDLQERDKELLALKEKSKKLEDENARLEQKISNLPLTSTQPKPQQSIVIEVDDDDDI